MRPVVWVGYLLPLPASGAYEGTEAHLAGHQVTLREVEQVCLYNNSDSTEWNDHPTRGRRLYVRGTTNGGRPLFCVLLPLPYPDDAYAVITAYEEVD